jgi:hypothetical protein
MGLDMQEIYWGKSHEGKWKRTVKAGRAVKSQDRSDPFDGDREG